MTSQRYPAVTRWRICVTMATLWQQQDGGYALLFYIFNSTVIDWTFIIIIIVVVVGKTNVIALMFILLVQVGLKQGKELGSQERCSSKREFSPNSPPLSSVVYPAVHIQQLSRQKLTWIIKILSVPRSKHTTSRLYNDYQLDAPIIIYS